MIKTREEATTTRENRGDFQMCCTIKGCANKKRNGRCSLPTITFGYNRSTGTNYQDCRDFQYRIGQPPAEPEGAKELREVIADIVAAGEGRLATETADQILAHVLSTLAGQFYQAVKDNRDDHEIDLPESLYEVFFSIFNSGVQRESQRLAGTPGDKKIIGSMSLAELEKWRIETKAQLREDILAELAGTPDGELVEIAVRIITRAVFRSQNRLGTVGAADTALEVVNELAPYYAARAEKDKAELRKKHSEYEVALIQDIEAQRKQIAILTAERNMADSHADALAQHETEAVKADVEKARKDGRQEVVEWLNAEPEGAKELRLQIDKEIDYLAHEIVVPITGEPSNQQERDSIEKYRAELGLFADRIKAHVLFVLTGTPDSELVEKVGCLLKTLGRKPTSYDDDAARVVGFLAPYYAARQEQLLKEHAEELTAAYLKGAADKEQPSPEV